MNDFDPTMPLRNEKRERFARLRAALMPRLEAAREAGYGEMSPSHIAKLDRRKDVRARVAELSKEDEELLRLKRARIEARLNLAAYSDVLQFAMIDPESGQITAIDWRKVAESDLAPIISDFSFDPKTGRLTKFERDNALNALNQLRDMFGCKATTKTDVTSGGAPIAYRVLTGVERNPGDAPASLKEGETFEL
jgi:hypothetical protein